MYSGAQAGIPLAASAARMRFRFACLSLYTGCSRGIACGAAWGIMFGRMVFAYYQRLSPRMRAIYRASDRVEEVRLRRPEELRPLALALQSSLATGDRERIAQDCRRLISGIAADLGVAAAGVRVLAQRPSGRDSELHGLYEPDSACIQVWMRTARHRRVVAFRTFLRTLLHELCHHLDYRWLQLPDSLHTEGFFARESSLFKQLLPPGGRDAAASPPSPPAPRPAAADGAVLLPRRRLSSLLSARREKD